MGSESVGLVNLNIMTFSIQVINFFVLLFVLNKFLVKPIIDMLDKRSNTIKDTLDKIELEKKEIADIKAKCNEELSELRKEKQKILTEALHDAEATKEKIISEILKNRAESMEKVAKEIEQERKKAMSDLRNEMVILACMLSEKLIGKNIKENDNKILIDEFTSQIGEQHI